LVGFTLFDPNVKIEDKKLMVANLVEQVGLKNPLPRFDAREVDVKKPLSSFVTISTRAFFQILELNDSFLSIPPESWGEDEDYCLLNELF
jgi:hypothetical protein